MRTPVLTLCAAALAFAAACTTTPAVSPTIKLDRQAGQDCRRHCDTLDMQLDAVVVIGNSTGCVCRPKEATLQRSPAASAGAAAAAGEVLRQAQAARDQQEADRRRRDDHHRPSPSGRP